MIRKTADAVAVVGAVAGSLLVASNSGHAFLGYVCFFASSIASVYLLMKTKDAPKSLLMLNFFFVAVNLFGIFRAA